MSTFHDRPTKQKKKNFSDSVENDSNGLSLPYNFSVRVWKPSAPWTSDNNPTLFLSKDLTFICLYLGHYWCILCNLHIIAVAIYHRINLWSFFWKIQNYCKLSHVMWFLIMLFQNVAIKKLVRRSFEVCVWFGICVFDGQNKNWRPVFP